MILSHPTSEALSWLDLLGPVVEMGYGDGRWSLAMTEAGIDVVGIEKDDGKALSEYPDHTVFMSWPPEHLAEEWIRGRQFVFVGDPQRYQNDDGNIFDGCKIIHKAKQPEGDKDGNYLIIGKGA